MAKQVLSAFLPRIKALNSEQINARHLFGLLEASTRQLNRQTSEFNNSHCYVEVV